MDLESHDVPLACSSTWRSTHPRRRLPKVLGSEKLLLNTELDRQAMVSDFKWANMVVACLRQLRESKECRVPFVDHEVIPPLNGSPDGIGVWFICEYIVLKERFRVEALSAATQRLRTMLVEAGFPAASAETLQSDVTSREEIERGGGKFYFFRR